MTDYQPRTWALNTRWRIEVLYEGKAEWSTRRELDCSQEGAIAIYDHLEKQYVNDTWRLIKITEKVIKTTIAHDVITMDQLK
jgi:hypothetical protein